MKTYYKTHRWLRIVSRILLVLVLLAAAIIAFLKLWPAFGAGNAASKEAQEDYAKRAENFKDGIFYNEETFEIMSNTDEEDPNTISTKDNRPNKELPHESSDITETAEDEVKVTWFGHSSMLLQMHGLNILMDPVWSERTSPVSFIGGSKRFSHPSITLEELPEIDVVLLSHDHYDHLDYQSLQEIDAKVGRYVVPLGVENHLKRWNIAEDKIQNMAWWEEMDVDGLTIACTPAQHYSGRSLDDQYHTLWASWVFKDEYHQIYESGDSGYAKHFEEIHEKYGDFDFALMDCAQYDVQWPAVHMFPEESIKAVQTLGAKMTMPIHWGAFSLAYHGWDDPVARFVKAGTEAGLTVLTPRLSQTVDLSTPEEYQEHWWETLQ